jgi:hypothetical protein
VILGVQENVFPARRCFLFSNRNEDKLLCKLGIKQNGRFVRKMANGKCPEELFENSLPSIINFVG